MSAYIVEKRLIGYIVGCDRYMETKTGFCNRDRTPVEQGQALRDENIRSVLYRYPQTTIQTAPGASDRESVFCEEDIVSIGEDSFDPVQLLKSIACLEYQSCEHDEWEQCQAKKYLDGLRADAVRMLPKWDEAEWGAPEKVKAN